MSGCGGEGDGVAECFELSDVVVFTGFGVGVAVEVLGTEVVEPGVRVLQEVPDDDEDGTADSDDGAFLAPSFGQPPMSPRQIRPAARSARIQARTPR